MTDAWAATIAKIDALRAKGATRVKIDGVEVEFGPLVAPPADRALTPADREALEAEKKREAEETLFWSAGGTPA